MVNFTEFSTKATKDGKAPIYARITIDGLDDEISLGKKVQLMPGAIKRKR
ncbi:hypothetical protein [Dyadobacter sp. 676]|uniref:Arm DNA-binding domain-containing protein n=1 Tax=Dyadobacter sp. 676 TaxID=3088362 RepID=A0AAU8FLR5_9BACT